MMKKSAFLRNNEGVSRILEAVIASVILFVVFSAATFMVQTSDVKTVQERSDLDRLGYNVLSNIMESGTMETIEAKALPPNVDNATYLRTAVQTYLPATVYFNLTIYSYADQITYAEMSPVVNNVANAESFASSTEISSTNLMYTSRNGNSYYAVLLLARAGGNS